MKSIDTALPMAAPIHTPEPAPEPAPPVSRRDLIQLLTRITQEAKMPPSVTRAKFVRLPAELYMEAHAVVLRELGGLAQVTEHVGQ